jgi:hypothetical protein
VAKINARRVLLAGFGSLLVLMIVAGTDSLIVLRQIRRSSAAIRKTYLTRNRELEHIRSGIYLSGTAVRDYLLAISPDDAADPRAKFVSVRTETDQALDAYSRTLEPMEVSAFRSLRGEIQAYWHLLETIFDRDSTDTRIHGSRYLYSQLAVRRTAMLELADRISAINENELTAGDEKLTETFHRFRVRQVAIFVLTIMGGVALAAMTIIYVLKLEEQARARYEESERTKGQLKELSARLVAAQEEERRSISRELHDEVGQTLSALLLETGAASGVQRESV